MPNIVTLGNGKRVIDTGLPQRQIKPIWIEMHKELNLKIMEAILNSNPTSGRVRKAIGFSISQILDDEVRDRIKTKIEQDLKEKVKPEMDKDEKADATENVYIEAVEGISDYLDTAFGISHRIAIGID